MVLLLGIDWGTTSYKVALFDQNGCMRAVRGGEVTISRLAPGWVEADAENTWQAIARAIREVVREAQANPREIAAIGATGTSNLVLHGIDGRVLRPAILYGDERVPSPQQLARLIGTLGEQRLGELLGFETLDPG
ncbi:MAG TPA: FGGY family carbohydrate kinase, partial [Anaerolineae bacterium]|nr:FGGY family carbohydrate kinase [Anaerolineae bacterium]